MIASLYLSHFATTRYRLEYGLPAHRPLVLIDAGSVYAMCNLAEGYGIHRAMGVEEARFLCPKGVFASVEVLKDVELLIYLYELLHDQISEIEVITSPQSPYFLMNLPVGEQPWLIEIARSLGRRVRSTSNQVPAIAIAPTLFTAKAVSNITTPGYIRFVGKHHVILALAEQPLTILPLSETTRERLRGVAIHTVGRFARLASDLVVAQFGEEGRIAHDLVLGRDTTSVRPWLPPTESLTFPEEGEQLSFLPTLPPKKGFQQLLPELIQRYGRDVFLRVQWRANREGWSEEEQVNLVPY